MLEEQLSDGQILSHAIAEKITHFRHEAHRRSDEKMQDVFKEIGKTLAAIAAIPVLKDDEECNILIGRLAGADDMDLFHDRVVAIETYIKKAAQRLGVDADLFHDQSSSKMTMTEMPDHMSDLDEELASRTRLQVR